MVDRPNNFDVTRPTGSSSPRAGDDELRNIKRFTQNGWNDFTEAEGEGIQRHIIYGQGFTITEDGGLFTGNVLGNLDGIIGENTPAAAAFTNVAVMETINGTLNGNVVSEEVTATTADIGTLQATIGTMDPRPAFFTTATATGGFVGDLTGNVNGGVTGGVVGDVLGNVTGDLTGNADTADAWSTARAIQIGADGAGDIVGTITGIDGADDVTATLTLRAGATQGTSVASAATWTTARNLDFTGDVTGSVSLDGSTDVSIPLTYSTNINAIDGLSPNNNNFIVGNGSTWTSQTGATARTSLGLGSAATSASTDFATAAQGQLAMDAVQPNEALDTGSGTLTVSGVVFSVSGGRVRVSSGGTTLFSVDTLTGDAIFRGSVTSRGTP